MYVLGNPKIDVVTVNERPLRESYGSFVATSVIEPLQTELTTRRKIFLDQVTEHLSVIGAK